MRALFLLTALLLAGCAAPESAESPPQLRTLAVGDNGGGADPLRRTFDDAETWGSFWRNFTNRAGGLQVGDAPPAPEPPPPTVDFRNERAVVVTLGEKPIGCWAVRVTSAAVEDGVLRMTVVSYAPPPGQECTFQVTRAFHAVAVRSTLTDVAFVEAEAGWPPPDAAS